MSMKVTGSGIVYPSGEIQLTPGYTGFRNLLINGDMPFDQRHCGAAYTVPTTDYTLDRWMVGSSVASKLSVQRVNDVPNGFDSALRVSVAAKYAPAAAEAFTLQQRIEGVNVTGLAFGTSGAMHVTTSHWIRSSVPGKYAVGLTNGAANRSIVGTMDVTTNWTRLAITFPGDTAGVWWGGNLTGLSLRFDLGSGANFTAPTPGVWQDGNYASAPGCIQFVNQAIGASLDITGAQLEPGIIATPFERTPIDLSERRCQRYYAKTFPQGTAPGRGLGVLGALGICTDSTPSYRLVEWTLPATMRSTPSLGTYSPFDNSINFCNSLANATSTPGGISVTDRHVLLAINNGQTMSTPAPDAFYIHVTADAEL